MKGMVERRRGRQRTHTGKAMRCSPGEEQVREGAAELRVGPVNCRQQLVAVCSGVTHRNTGQDVLRRDY